MEQQRALVCRQVMMTNSRRLVVPEVHVAIDLVLKFMVDEGCRGFREQRHVVAVIESQRCTVISRKHSSYIHAMSLSHVAAGAVHKKRG